MSEHIGTINLEETSTVTWPIASGYTNGIGPDTPSDKIMNEFGVHFYRLGSRNFNKDYQFILVNISLPQSIMMKGVTLFDLMDIRENSFTKLPHLLMVVSQEVVWIPPKNGTSVG